MESSITKRSVQHPHGTRNTFHKNMSKQTFNIYRLGSALDSGDQKMVYKLCKNMDTQKSGNIFPDDLRRALAGSGLKMSPSVIDAVVKSYPVDNRDRINYDQFIKNSIKLYNEKKNESISIPLSSTLTSKKPRQDVPKKDSMKDVLNFEKNRRVDMRKAEIKRSQNQDGLDQTDLSSADGIDSLEELGDLDDSYENRGKDAEPLNSLRTAITAAAASPLHIALSFSAADISGKGALTEKEFDHVLESEGVELDSSLRDLAHKLGKRDEGRKAKEAVAVIKQIDAAETTETAEKEIENETLGGQSLPSEVEAEQFSEHYDENAAAMASHPVSVPDAAKDESFAPFSTSPYSSFPSSRKKIIPQPQSKMSIAPTEDDEGDARNKGRKTLSEIQKKIQKEKEEEEKNESDNRKLDDEKSIDYRKFMESLKLRLPMSYSSDRKGHSAAQSDSSESPSSEPISPPSVSVAPPLSPPSVSSSACAACPACPACLHPQQVNHPPVTLFPLKDQETIPAVQTSASTAVDLSLAQQRPYSRYAKNVSLSLLSHSDADLDKKPRPSQRKHLSDKDHGSIVTHDGEELDDEREKIKDQRTMTRIKKTESVDVRKGETMKQLFSYEWLARKEKNMKREKGRDASNEERSANVEAETDTIKGLKESEWGFRDRGKHHYQVAQQASKRREMMGFEKEQEGRGSNRMSPKDSLSATIAVMPSSSSSSRPVTAQSPSSSKGSRKSSAAASSSSSSSFSNWSGRSYEGTQFLNAKGEILQKMKGFAMGRDEREKQIKEFREKEKENEAHAEKDVKLAFAWQSFDEAKTGRDPLSQTLPLPAQKPSRTEYLKQQQSSLQSCFSSDQQKGSKTDENYRPIRRHYSCAAASSSMGSLIWGGLPAKETPQYQRLKQQEAEKAQAAQRSRESNSSAQFMSTARSSFSTFSNIFGTSPTPSLPQTRRPSSAIVDNSLW
ncbi:uncharacterized protein MONOS_2904 [Monocercomonoides exilis]|uniref:uncharacterized protein n=1 Tax=Monocercomonoides exilis TaxID=2049356 RepID=UPI00355A48DD|nr:hypothetical protein MONOS_2904 [Monocercomonoides exilis]|eukprot:MONOS_2904.1-p1 / transcript=MONOS_2904.1 / gene=MONOS_2904 / organism=Monocercomonoides_exilis_PA203 / gene_product=unspecified product / transcript_product=unspecified product / location=Mono_scaffold00063:120448-124555(-) / protein_length=955 / sequence_SO=supercontig / SO=protein_coding / is_pseudo=false